MQSNKKLRTALILLGLLLAFGTIGFKLLLHLDWFDCFYFTLITVSTIGYSEPANMTEGARYFTSAVIILGVGSLGYALSSVVQTVVESGVISAFGKRRMFRDIGKLHGHYIVCGAGRVGSRVIREIAHSGHDYVVIESDEVSAEKLLTEGALVLMGDATDEVVLRAAGLERARGLVCAVASDPDNLYITLTARDLNKDLLIIARANDEAAVDRLRKAGANRVVSPVLTGSARMAQMLLRPAVADFMELATMTERLELEIEQVEIGPGSPFIGRALKDTGIRTEHGVIVIAIKRANGHMIFNPPADTTIEECDVFVAIGSHESVQTLEKLANPARTSVR
ncbi:MAG TPA: potassium channel protein [Blastocatellia bacterium]|nr:potassium channel protein [Blastocatellia bacterium]